MTPEVSVSLIECPSCKKMFSSRALKCPDCGKNSPEASVCLVCNRQIIKNSLPCPHCGDPSPRFANILLEHVFFVGGKEVGPLTPEKAREMVRNKHITKMTKAWKKGLNGFSSIQELPELKTALTALLKGNGRLIECSGCKGKYSSRVSACPNCGTMKEVRKKKCNVCQTLILAESRTCPKCGDPSPFGVNVKTTRSQPKMRYPDGVFLCLECGHKVEDWEVTWDKLSETGLCPNCQASALYTT